MKLIIVGIRSIFIQFQNEMLVSEKIKQHDTTQADFINIATHELKTLTHVVIIGYSELLQMDFEGDDNINTYNHNTTKKVLKVIVRSANELQKLINDILNIAKN
jgi:signal transduction histidine kinase